MKTIVVALIGLMTFQSCDLFKSKDEMLTNEKWVLHSRFINNSGDSSSDLIFYKKSDQVLTLTFNTAGTVRITEDNGKKSATIRWFWKNDDKKYITLDKGNYSGDFHIVDLSVKEFQWSKLDFHIEVDTMDMYRRLNDPEWNDEEVELMNSLK